MTLRHLAISNIKGNWHRYLAYFLSCTFTVHVFYLFISFVLHPAVAEGYILGGAAEGVRSGMMAAEVVILIFSFVFVWYSTSAFLRSRKKEFGLLTLLGMTKRQQRALVWLEYTAISTLSVAVGLASGILFSKLFFMAMSVLLAVPNPIYFFIPPLAVQGTVVVFLALFAALSVVAIFHLRQSSVRELLVAKRQAKPLPRWRPGLFFIGVLLMGCGYGMAWVTDLHSLLQNMFPILGLVIVGTYLLVSQGGVAVCQWLEKRGGVYFRGTNMISLNRLTFRLRENSRVIFSSAILIAVVCTALGTFNTVLQSARSMAYSDNAFAVMSRVNMPIEDLLATNAAGDAASVALERRCGEKVDWCSFEGLSGRLQLDEWGMEIVAVAERDYLAARKIAPHLPTIELAPGRAAYFIVSDQTLDTNLQGALSLRSTQLEFEQITVFKQALLNYRTALVVTDADYELLAAESELDDRHQYFCFELRNWEKVADAASIVSDALPDCRWAVSRVEMYAAVRSIGALTMFIGVFVSFLFFVASGSLLYFKLFTEIDVDRQQYATLRDVGITRRETMCIVNRELGVLFFLPVAIGALHMSFAMKTLSNLLQSFKVAPASAMVAGIYAVLQLGYFLLARSAYLQQLEVSTSS
jgi:putative ABC transport system permease protein